MTGKSVSNGMTRMSSLNGSSGMGVYSSGSSVASSAVSMSGGNGTGTPAAPGPGLYSAGHGNFNMNTMMSSINPMQIHPHKPPPSSHVLAMGPQPGDEEVERRLNDILKSMDLPPDKAKILRSYDSKKKWELICDQERVIVKDPPYVYLNKLRQLIDPKMLSAKAKSLTMNPKASKVKNGSGSTSPMTSTQTLRNLETSLRTNSIEWVREFLNEENGGLDVLVDYLASRLAHMKDDAPSHGSSQQSVNGNGYHSSRASFSSSAPGEKEKPSHSRSMSGIGLGGLSQAAHKSLRLSRSSAQKRLGQPQDDVHVCILCLRAIMNNKFGFNMVISRADTINYIALSLVHKSLRTKALVLELLAAICLVKGGHEMILSAFDNFKTVHHEKHRFETLMYYFKNYEDFNIDFMVACMQFINILVHSVECMNYRVFLQYEFTVIGLDDYLEKLKHHESEELTTQIAAYLDNVFDVTALMKDAELSHAALEQVAELEDELSHAQERVKNTENAALGKIASLETRLTDVARERDDLKTMHQQTDQELNTLRRTMTQKEEESRRLLTARLGELESLQQRVHDGGPLGDAGKKAGSGAGAPPPPPPPPPPLGGPGLAPGGKKPPPPPPAPGFPSLANSASWNGEHSAHNGVGPPPPVPPAPGMAEAPFGALTIKRKVNTKHKLPVLNWTVLKPNQVKGTIFNELDDEKILSSLDFSGFEEQFKTGQVSQRASALLNGNCAGDQPDTVGVAGFAQNAGNGNLAASHESSPSKARFKRVEKVSLLEANRLRNLAIMRRNIEMSNEEVVAALNNFDMRALSQDYIEVMLRISPGEEEIKKYRDYDRDKKPFDVLTHEDKFLLQLSCQVERLGQKLQIMNFINTFQTSIQTLTPQLQSIFTASRAVKKSDKFRKILELVLAFGNYLNSSRRGPAYGFKLQSLESLLDLKSSDKKTTLLHFIVQTVEEKYPHLLDFDNELIFIDKAAEVSLENVITDIHELDKGMDVTRRECELKKPTVSLLREFITENETLLSKLQKEQKIAVEAFSDVAEYFGESKRTIQPKDFFVSILRFSKAFRAAHEENTLRRLRLLEASQGSGGSPSGGLKIKARKSQDAVMSELKNKASNIKEKKLMPQEEVYHGALEDILLGLKNEPYRRADALRRSQRRKDGVALSQVMSDLDL